MIPRAPSAPSSIAPRRPLAKRAVVATALALGLGGAGEAGATAPSTGLLYERALMSAAGARCRLFTPPVAAALAAGVSGARASTLAAGASATEADAARDRATARADTLDCRSPDLAVAAARVRSAYAGYARMPVMAFPGRWAGWRATRGVGPGWRLRQEDGGASLGVAGEDEGLAALVADPRAAGASGARLVLRDTDRVRAPYLDPRRSGLAGRLPPASLTRAILAADKAPAPAGLSPSGPRSGGTLFRFPASASAALAALDPREAVALEVVHAGRGGEAVERYPFEVGDFAAARAFLSAR